MKTLALLMELRKDTEHVEKQRLDSILYVYLNESTASFYCLLQIRTDSLSRYSLSQSR